MAALPDQPSLSTAPAGGEEDNAIPLAITAALTDIDGSELLAVTVAGVPSGAVLSMGTDNGDGSWTLTPDQLDDLTITPPADSDRDFVLSILATATEQATGETATTTRDLPVTVAALPDQPSLSTAPAGGTAGTAIPLDIAATLADLDGSEVLSVAISGLPEGGVLSAGTDNGDGNWALTRDQLIDLAITPPAESAEDFVLSVPATATERTTGETTTATRDLPVTVEVQPEPTASDPDAGGPRLGETSLFDAVDSEIGSPPANTNDGTIDYLDADDGDGTINRLDEEEGSDMMVNLLDNTDSGTRPDDALWTTDELAPGGEPLDADGHSEGDTGQDAVIGEEFDLTRDDQDQGMPFAA